MKQCFCLNILFANQFEKPKINYYVAYFKKKKLTKSHFCSIFHFSYDTRGAHSEEPSHWKDDEILESRASFRKRGEPDELIINPVLVSILSFNSFPFICFNIYSVTH